MTDINDALKGLPPLEVKEHDNSFRPLLSEEPAVKDDGGNAEGEQRCVCPECNELFKSKQALGAHRRIKHGVNGKSDTAVRDRRKQVKEPDPDEEIDLVKVRDHCIEVYKSLGGPKLLQRIAQDDPIKFVSVWHKVEDLLNKSKEGDGSVVDMSDDELESFVKELLKD